MKIITCASYYGSGSSALTDLIAEYEGVKDLSSFEFRFLHDIDGISDLEYHLCQCHNRHNSGHALKRFIKLSKYNEGNYFSKRYEYFFNGQYRKLTDEYIKTLLYLQFVGWWFYDLFDKGINYYYFMQAINHVLRKLPGKRIGILKNEITYCAHPSEQKFLSCTRKYINNLMRAANPKDLPYLEIDQLVPSQNINRVLRYFQDEIYVFVIDRDPRDIYTLEKFYWHGHICPTEDVNTFCDWYLYTRKSGKAEEYDPKHVIRLQFEDLIYHYDETVKIIEEITGLSTKQHLHKFTKLNPKRSVNNTQIWKKHNIDKEISIIEERLSNYLYSFDKVKHIKIPGIEVSDTTSF